MFQNILQPSQEEINFPKKPMLSPGIKWAIYTYAIPLCNRLYTNITTENIIL